MPGAIDRLLKHRDTAIGGPKSDDAIGAVQNRIGVALPDQLLRLWQAGEGVRLDTLHAHIPGPQEVLDGFEEGVWGDVFPKRGFIPVLDDHQSNCLALIVKAPLAFRVAYIPHDDGSRLIYRSLDSLADGVFSLLESVGSADDFYEEPGDYPPDGPRPLEDQEAAVALLETDGENEKWNYAAQLLDESNIKQWEKIIESDHFKRRDAMSRMAKMKSPAIQELLRKQREEFQSWSAAVVEAARQAGFEIGAQQGATVQIGGVWKNLDAFFYRRNVPNAIPRLMLWFRDQAEKKNPYDRPGHLMDDSQ